MDPELSPLSESPASLTLHSNEFVRLRVRPLGPEGEPEDIQSPTYSVSDDTVLLVALPAGKDDHGPFFDCDVLGNGKAGAPVITFDGDGDLGDGVAHIGYVFNLTVLGLQADHLVAEASAPALLSTRVNPSLQPAGEPAAG